jgi:hypothetical protein
VKSLGATQGLPAGASGWRYLWKGLGTLLLIWGALALIGGAVLVVDLRLLGLGLRRQSVAQLARDAQPWLAGGLVVMVVSGILLFLSEAVKCYYSAAFLTKMTFLFPAIVFTFTVRRRVAAADDTRVRPLWRKLVALVSVTLWTVVAASGRWIGFSG